MRDPATLGRGPPVGLRGRKTREGGWMGGRRRGSLQFCTKVRYQQRNGGGACSAVFHAYNTYLSWSFLEASRCYSSAEFLEIGMPGKGMPRNGNSCGRTGFEQKDLEQKKDSVALRQDPIVDTCIVPWLADGNRSGFRDTKTPTNHTEHPPIFAPQVVSGSVSYPPSCLVLAVPANRVECSLRRSRDSGYTESARKRDD